MQTERLSGHFGEARVHHPTQLNRQTLKPRNVIGIHEHVGDFKEW